jgi:hypothetical protein
MMTEPPVERGERSIGVRRPSPFHLEVIGDKWYCDISKERKKERKKEKRKEEKRNNRQNLIFTRNHDIRIIFIIIIIIVIIIVIVIIIIHF